MKKKNRSKLHKYNICVCQVKNFQSCLYRFSIHEMVLFRGSLDPKSAKYGSILKNFSPEVGFMKTKTAFEESFKNFEFWQKRNLPKVINFGPSQANVPLENPAYC